MQQINFGHIDFSRIPQQEDEARRRQYQALSDLARGLGQGVAKGAEMWSNAYQQQLAEDWKNKQWENQIQNQMYDRQYRLDRDEIADQRYAEEIARREALEESSRDAAEDLRQEFLQNFNSRDLDKYGPSAQFALSRIRNARNWNDIVAGGESLATVIQYRDALEAQQNEKAAASAAEAVQLAGPRLSRQIGSSMAASGLDPDDLGAVYRATPREQRQSVLDELKSYRDQLVQFQEEHPGMLTEEMQKQLHSINRAIRLWGRRMGSRPVQF